MASVDNDSANGFIGVFILRDDTKLAPYLEALRNSIYEYVAVELFEDTLYCAAGATLVSFAKQDLQFENSDQTYESTNLLPGNAVTTYNTDCIFYADYSGAPIFFISKTALAGSWTTITPGSQFVWDAGATTATAYYIRIVSTTAFDCVNSFGLLFSRKSRFRAIITEFRTE